MKYSFTTLFLLAVIIACSPDNKNTMVVQGEITNLKKGVLYLQKMKDTIIISVDSISLDGTSTFILTDEVESPEIYYLSLDRSPSKRISFFGEVGNIAIKTKLDKFSLGATINGLSNQQLLDEYNQMKNKFSNKRLDLIKGDFEAQKSEDSLKVDSIQSEINNLIKRKYYYTTNFAVNHSDHVIAPYLALTELYDANIALLDTINNSLSPRIKESKYGKKLDGFITDIKSKE